MTDIAKKILVQKVLIVFFFQAEDGIRDLTVTGVQTCALPIFRGKVLRFEPPKVFQYTFAMGQNDKASRATIELVPETEATKVTVTHDEWAEDDPTYAACADGWPRILSRLKTLLETGKTFKPH